MFYSWQSDLPNNKNRGLINNAISKALKNIYDKNNNITEFIIESDSRNEMGTPDLVDSIFKKINECDIFIADVSIINSNSDLRKTPNPNVLIELGYASKALGWSNIICIYNTEYARIEDLPFDIRFRKPVTYNTKNEKSKQKKLLIKILESQIQDIIDYGLYDKKLYAKQKRTIDIAMQAILIDFCKILFKDKEGADRYNYPFLLNSTADEISSIIQDKDFLGFDLYKNVMLNINDFNEFYKDEIETYFLSEKEKKVLVKLIFELKNYKEFIDSLEPVSNKSEKTKYIVVSGKTLNSENPPNRYILLKKIDSQKSIVIDSGEFRNNDIDNLLKIYKLNNNSDQFSIIIERIANVINEWIRITGNYFIVNERLIES